MRSEETLGQGIWNTKTGPAHRRPYWVVGLALLGMVAVLLAVAFLVGNHLRPRVGVESAPAVARATRPTEVPAGYLPPTAEPAVKSATATVPVASPTSTGAPTGVSVANSPLEREIEAGYLRYWDVLSQAYLNLDTSRLPEAMSGAELGRQEQEIRSLQAQGKAAKLDVEHRVAFPKVSQDYAVVYDEYLNSSVFLDPITKKERPNTAPVATEKISFEMRKVDGVWRVVDARRHD